MPLFYLSPELIQFPDPNRAEIDGMLAVGGDLSPQRLLMAYRMGIFPWYNEDMPILWWSPDPRCIIDLAAFRAPRRVLRSLGKWSYRVTVDTAFESVIRACAVAPRARGAGTWLVPEMIEAYCLLHELGFAHSVEAWEGAGASAELVGGIYGVSIGRAFFGESMFYRKTGASKTALIALVRMLQSWGFDFLDCQQTNEHILRFGAAEVPRREFLRRVGIALRSPTLQGKWGQQLL